MALPFHDESTPANLVISAVELETRLGQQILELWIQAVRLHQRAVKGQNSQYCSSPRWDGGRDAAGRRSQPIWPKIAKFVLSHHLDPVQFVRSQFHGRLSNAPTPNMCLTPSAVQRYKEYSDKIFTRLTFEFQQQNREAEYSLRRFLQDGYQQDQACRLVIDSGFTVLSPLYRYCLAVATGHSDLADVWEPDALSQFMLNPDDLERIFGAFLPVQLQQKLPPQYRKSQ